MAVASSPDTAAQTADLFLRTLAKHCSSAYAGRVVANGGDGNGFGGRVLIMQITDCTDDQVRMPFQVGDDAAHALVLRRTQNGLHLEHAHSRQDGMPHALSSYGGDSANGTETRQEFHVDPYSIAKLEREGIAHAAGNVWALEVVSGTTLRYELKRAENPPLVIEFDLANPVSMQETVIAYSARVNGGELIATETM